MTPPNRLWVGLTWLAGAGLLLLAGHLQDPLLMPVRHLAQSLTFGLCSVGLLLWWRARRRWYAWVGALPLLLALMLASSLEYRWRAEKAELLASQDPALRTLGAHFIVGMSEPQTLEPLIRQGLIAGVFITARNVHGQSIDSLRQMIQHWQSLRRDAGLPALIIAADQEGGVVSHLSPPLTQRPPLATLLQGEPTPVALSAAAFAYGAAQGSELATLGVTLDLSPVVDLKPATRARLDFHSAITLRAISPDPAQTSAVALAYVQGLEHSGVHATLKHFPGLGGVPEDTHHFSATLRTPVAQLQRTDWQPFRQVARQTHALIMLGHVTLPELDAQNPASFSANVVQRIIRHDWQHQGVLITDDLTMAAAYSHGICQAAVKALNAGVDLLLISYDEDKLFPALGCAQRALQDGSLAPATLQRSTERLAATFTAPK
ncbi:MAG: Beta-hexosaminidase [Stenotrophomonas maltophilia]|nr:MAG: Beta-hexosaminidase [Stenotrophomonas maltophilia]